MLLQLRDKSDFIPELAINAQRLQAESVQHPFFPLSNRWSFRPDPNPSSSIPQAQILKWRTKTRLFINLILLRPIRYYFFKFHLRFFLLPFIVLDRL
jgi:hypothetical protein